MTAMGEVCRMRSTARLGLSLIPLLAALLISGCKSADKQEDEVDAGVAPPAASSAALPSATVATAVPPPVNPTPIAAPKADAGTTSSDAGTTTADAGATIADAGTTTADAGSAAAAAAAFKACSDRCQGVLQSCAIPTMSADGGLPQMKDPVACQAAATACFAACKP